MTFGQCWYEGMYMNYKASYLEYLNMHIWEMFSKSVWHESISLLVPFTLASKNRGFSKIANLRWKLLSNFLKTTKKPRQKNPPEEWFFFFNSVWNFTKFASVNARHRKIVIFHHVTFATARLLHTYTHMHTHTHTHTHTYTHTYTHIQTYTFGSSPIEDFYLWLTQRGRAWYIHTHTHTYTQV